MTKKDLVITGYPGCTVNPAEQELLFLKNWYRGTKHKLTVNLMHAVCCKWKSISIMLLLCYLLLSVSQ